MFQNRLDIKSSGSQAPVVPELPRSARGKRSARKKVEDHQTCAIDLLANLASKLLSETEGFQRPYHPANGTVEQVQIEKDNLSKFEAFDQLSCSEDVLRAQHFLKKQIIDDSKDHSEASKETSPGHASLLVKSDISYEDAIGAESEFVGHNCKIGSGMHVDEKYGEERLHDSYIELNKCKELKSKTTLQAQEQISRNPKVRKTSYIDDPVNLNANSPGSGSSDSSIEAPLHRTSIPHNGFFHKKEDDTNLAVHKYDDDNSSGCTHSTNINSKASRLQHNGDYHRIKKALASKFRKVAPRVAKDGDATNHDVEKKPALQRKRMCYTSQKTQRRSFKRRKLFERYSESAHQGGIYHQGLSDLFKKGGIKLETNGSHGPQYGENGAWSCRTEAKSSYKSPGYHVTLNIKSFAVPELLIEIPETATVGYLKRTVMDAVTSILVGGLRVGVLLQGNKVTDDSKTLHQAGISQGDKLDSLGFILEPNSRQAPMKLTSSKDPRFRSLGCSSEEPARFPTDQWRSDDRPQPVQTHSKSDYNVAHPPIDTSSPENLTTDSLALVAVPPNNVEELAMVSLHNKPKTKRSEVVQRRVRRPFSVAEVEALVQAVEKLGTGRWRDVKLCAFENAKHRTYVDLKDKWKTLVHTAKISPQQRRGEPVPQELLDRVLSAHAFWSQQQAKLQVKPPPPAATTCLLSYPVDCKPTNSCTIKKKEENMNIDVGIVDKTV